MPRKKKKRNTTAETQVQCKFCFKFYKNIQAHFYQNQVCSDFNTNYNLTLISGVNAICPSEPLLNTHNINCETYAYHHTNDMDDIVFESQCLPITFTNNTTTEHLVNVNSSNNKRKSIDKDLQIAQQSENSMIELLKDRFDIVSKQSYDDNDSINSLVSINDNLRIYSNENYLNKYTATCQQIDSMITTFATSTQMNSHNNSNSNDDQSHNLSNCLYNFTQQQLHVLKQMSYLPIDRGMISSIKLLKIMKDSNIASCNYSKLIDWHYEASTISSGSYSTSIKLMKSKKNVIEYLHNILFQLNNEKYCMKPKHEILILPSNRTTRISTFDLKSSLLALLTDPELMQRENLLLYDDSYNDPSNIQSEIYKDIHHGNAFKTAHEKFCTEPYDVLVPIIPFIDGTPIDPYGRNKLEVFMYTLGIFNQSTRHKIKAWRLAGYIPDPCNENAGQHDFYDLSQKKQRIAKRKDYHAMLNHIVKEFVHLEQSDGIILNLPNKDGTKMMNYRFKFVILFLIGDAVGHDKLCDRFISYGKSVKRLCRDCNCPSKKLDSYKHHCTFTKRSDIKAMNAKELLKISYYKIDNNALDDLSFGGNEYGMNGCLPPEPLHQLNQGVFKKMLDYFEDCLTSKGEMLIDKFVKYLSMNSHRQANRDFPKIDVFKDGLDKCQLSGTEIIYKVYIIYLCLVQTFVIRQLPKDEANSKRRYKKKKHKQNKDQHNDNDENKEGTYVEKFTILKFFYKKIGQSKKHILKWIKLFESTLCLDAWINQESFLKSDLKCINKNDSRADIAIRNYLKLYKKLVKEPIGNGTKTSKIHWLLHIPRYIRAFGPPKAYNGQTPEHCLSPLVKDNARNTQLRPSTLIEQSCERYYENGIIERSNDMLKAQNAVESKPTEPYYVTKLRHMSSYLNKRAYESTGTYQILITNDHKFNKIVWKQNNYKRNQVVQNTSLIQLVINRFRHKDYSLESKFINCVTTIHMMEPNMSVKHTYRADPYYYKRPWHDWCSTTWDIDEDDNENRDEFPSRILMIIDTKDMQFGTNISDLGRYLAVVRATEHDTRSTSEQLNHQCQLIDTYDKDQFIRIVSCDTITKPLFVIPDVSNVISDSYDVSFESNHVIKIKDKIEWSRLFLNSEWI